MKIDLLPYWDTKQLHHIPELCSKIIDGMQRDGEVFLHTFDGKNPCTNGLIELLDALCKFWEWDKSKITLCISNQLKVDEYNYVPTQYHHALYSMDLNVNPVEWNKEKYYGMFIGRATAARAHAAHQHRNFMYKEHGLTSFHGNVFDEINEKELLEYLMFSGKTYQELVTLIPYSDIDVVRETPIYYPTCTDKNIWELAYEKIAIEIVCESYIDSTDDYLSCITEKTLRPMLYKRPFLLVGPKNQIENLKLIGFKTFDSIFNESYDQYTGIERVNHIFSVLEDIISSGKIEKLLEDAEEILEHNYRAAKKLCVMWRLRPSYEELINEK